jgi:peptidoglycan/xylan/chitin deacetylase (PgdA/CDA1 family)
MTNAKLLIKRSIKSTASVAKARVGFPSPAPGSVNIIAYHRVVADIAKAERDSIYGLVVSAGTFRRHCELLKRAYDVVSLETAMYFLDGERTVRRPLAVITFDDGYLDFYEEAFPILNEFGLPATVFLPTECIGQDKPLAHDRIFWLLKQARAKSVSIKGALSKAGLSYNAASELSGLRSLLKLTDAIVYLPCKLREKVIAELENELGDFADYPREYRLLDWEMVREMARKGISFGAHTANHVVLPLEDESAMEAEIVASKKELERQLGGKRVISFAYPNGEYNARIRRLIAQAGYKIAVTTEKRINPPGGAADLLALGRISLSEESTRGIKGIYSPGVAKFRLGA